MTSIFGTLRRNPKKPDSAQESSNGAKPPTSGKSSRHRKQTIDLPAEEFDTSELPNINSQFKRSLSLSKSGRCKSHSKQPANRKSILTSDELYKQPNQLGGNTSSPSSVRQQQQPQDYQQQTTQSKQSQVQNGQGAKSSPTVTHGGPVKSQTYEYNLPPSALRNGQSTAL